MASDKYFIPKTTIHENGIPFDLKQDIPDATTAAAIKEGKKLASDKKVKGYKNIKDLRKALDV